MNRFVEEERITAHLQYHGIWSLDQTPSPQPHQAHHPSQDDGITTPTSPHQHGLVVLDWPALSVVPATNAKPAT
jgi:hypothetical protein